MFAYQVKRCEWTLEFAKEIFIRKRVEFVVEEGSIYFKSNARIFKSVPLPLFSLSHGNLYDVCYPLVEF